MSLIGFLARKQHGKDTASDYLVREYGYTKMALATPLKEVCKILFGFNEDQLYGNAKEDMDTYWDVSPRAVYQYLGTDIFRMDINKIIPKLRDTFWVKCMENRIHQMRKLNKNINIVISDVRFHNEVDMIHRLGGIVIKIYRPNIINESNHIAEYGIDDIKLHTDAMYNEGTKDELYKKLDKFMRNI